MSRDRECQIPKIFSWLSIDYSGIPLHCLTTHTQWKQLLFPSNPIKHNNFVRSDPVATLFWSAFKPHKWDVYRFCAIWIWLKCKFHWFWWRKQINRIRLWVGILVEFYWVEWECIFFSMSSFGLIETFFFLFSLHWIKSNEPLNVDIELYVGENKKK